MFEEAVLPQETANSYTLVGDDGETVPYLNARNGGHKGIDLSILYEKVLGNEYSMAQP